MNEISMIQKYPITCIKEYAELCCGDYLVLTSEEDDIYALYDYNDGSCVAVMIKNNRIVDTRFGNDCIGNMKSAYDDLEMLKRIKSFKEKWY